MIDAAIIGIDSTVPVTSRSAYSLRSAGARSAEAAQITAPTEASWSVISSGLSVGPPARDGFHLVQRAAGVPEAPARTAAAPPPRRPRPAAPAAARSCPPHRRSSACPPSAGPRRTGPAGSPEAIIAAVQAAISAPVHAVEQDRHQQRGHLLLGDLPAGVGVDHPVDLRGR